MSDEHEYEPDFARAGDPCKACGFGRHHPWHPVEEDPAGDGTRYTDPDTAFAGYPDLSDWDSPEDAAAYDHDTVREQTGPDA